MNLIVVVGPTASGKTWLGVRAAHRLGTEIISADSRQVYRGLDLGSGKDRDLYRRVEPSVRCHLLDVADPDEPYTLYHYQRDVYAVLRAWRSERPMLLVGGTGLYVEAVLKQYRIANVPEDAALRRQLQSVTREELERRLGEIDPELAGATDRSSKKRMIRALEIHEASRRGPVSHSTPLGRELSFRVFRVAVPRELLHARIEARLDERLNAGLLEEVQGLMDAGLSWERLKMLGLEYREVASCLRGDKTESEMRDDLLREIRRFAKRQETWFNGLPRRGISVRSVGPEAVDRLIES